MYRLLCAGVPDRAADVALEVESLRRCVSECSVDLHRLGRTLQDALDCAVTQETGEFERSSLLELQSAQKRQRLRVRMEPHRAHKKRIALDGIHDADGVAICSPQEVSDALVSEWAPVFEDRGTDLDAMSWFLAFAPKGAGRSDWKWPRGKLRDVASAMPESSPRPDGLTHGFGLQRRMTLSTTLTTSRRRPLEVHLCRPRCFVALQCPYRRANTPKTPNASYDE